MSSLSIRRRTNTNNSTHAHDTINQDLEGQGQEVKDNIDHQIRSKVSTKFSMRINYRSKRFCGLLKFIAIFAAAYTLGYNSKSLSFLKNNNYYHHYSSITNYHHYSTITTQSSLRSVAAAAASESNSNNGNETTSWMASTLSFIPPKDPYLQPLNCHSLLESYRNQQIPQLKDDTTYHKSYVRLITSYSSSTKLPFYISTSDEQIDRMRVTLFQTGDYYETVMSSSMQNILDDESKQLTSNKNSLTKSPIKRPIMLDVGGNVGWFTLLSAAHNAEVYVFEPNVVNMIRFCESLVLNGEGMLQQVHPFLKGVSDAHGIQQKMYKVDPKNPGSFSFSKEVAEASGKVYDSIGSSSPMVEELEGEPLQLITLDALAQDQGWLDSSSSSATAAVMNDNDDSNNNTTKSGGSGSGEENDDQAGTVVPTTSIAILKIDVEGLELKVLQGAKQLLKTKQIKNIFMELKKSSTKDDDVELWEEMFTILIDDSGYGLYKLGDHTGPTDVIEEEIRNGKEAARFIAKKEFDNANVWLR